MKIRTLSIQLGYLLSVVFQPYLAEAESAFLKGDKVCVSKDSRDCFAQQFRTGTDKLKIIGATFFSWMVFDVYSAALYGTDGVAKEKNFNGSEPIALEIRYHRAFTKDEMIEVGDKILKAQNAPVDVLKIRLEKINAAYRDVVDGDTYTLTYSPKGEGETSLLLNGELLTTIPGKDFATTYFNIWLAEQDAFDQSVRDALFRGGI